MHLVERTRIGIVLFGLRAVRRIKSRVHVYPAQRGHAKGFAHHVHMSCRFPKADLDARV